MLDLIGIPLALVVICTLILWILIWGRGHWSIKSIIVVASLYVCIGVYASLPDLLGWPTDDPLPPRFQIHWLVVNEPALQGTDKGEIYVWSANLEPHKIKEQGDWVRQVFIPFHNKRISDEPRLHKMPYSRELHKQCESIKNHIKSGRPFYGTMDPKKGIQGEKGKKGQGQGRGQGQGQGRYGGRGKGVNGLSPSEMMRKGFGGRGQGGDFSQPSDGPRFYQLPPPKFSEKVTGAP